MYDIIKEIRASIFLERLNKSLEDGYKVHTLTTPSICTQTDFKGRIADIGFRYVAFIYKDNEKNDKQELLNFETT